MDCNRGMRCSLQVWRWVLQGAVFLFVVTGTLGCAVAKPEVRPRRMTVRTTAYTAGEPGGSYSAAGGRLRVGGAVSSAATSVVSDDQSEAQAEARASAEERAS